MGGARRPSVVVLVALGVLFGGQATTLVVTGSKILLCAFAVNLLSRLTDFGGVLSALRALGLPTLATTLMLIAHRYIETLSAEGTRTAQAFTFHGRPALARSLRQYAMLGSSLMVRAVERSERIAIALKANGFNGELPVKPLPPMGLTDAGFLSLTVCALLLATYWRI